MRALISSVDLLNRRSGEFEPANLFQGIEETNLEDVQRDWVPVLLARHSTASSGTEGEHANVQDAHWDWRGLVSKRAGQLAYESFSVECGGTTQGLMLTKATAFSRLKSQSGLDLVYVEYIATAPMNRQGFTKTPVYKGVGRILLVAAISLSQDLGFKGRIGLHALPQSASWYRDVCGMTDLGPDTAIPPGVMHYFEMTEAQAQSFLS